MCAYESDQLFPPSSLLWHTSSSSSWRYLVYRFSRNPSCILHGHAFSFMKPPKSIILLTFQLIFQTNISRYPSSFTSIYSNEDWEWKTMMCCILHVCRKHSSLARKLESNLQPVVTIRAMFNVNKLFPNMHLMMTSTPKSIVLGVIYC